MHTVRLLNSRPRGHVQQGRRLEGRRSQGLAHGQHAPTPFSRWRTYLGPLSVADVLVLTSPRCQRMNMLVDKFGAECPDDDVLYLIAKATRA